MLDGGRSKAADIVAKLDALVREPEPDVEAITREADSLRAACDPRVKDLLRRLDALIGARHPGIPADRLGGLEGYVASPEEKVLLGELWDVLGEPGVPPLVLDRFGPIDLREYALEVLREEVVWWLLGQGGRDWGGRVWP